MGRRALIIAIEDYPKVADGSVATHLDGTLRSAVEFRDWLIAKWEGEGVASADCQILVCSEPPIEGGRSAEAEDVTQAMLDLKNAGQNATEEFFFYFSGHGFSFVRPDSRSDVLITSSYRSMELSGSSCLQLDKAIYWLRQHLGVGHQYYFVDACRNDLDGRRINPGGVVPPSDPQTTEEATTFLLQSTAPSATAAVDGRFSTLLLAGLKGAGVAKMWDESDDDAMMVRFDTLRGFVKQGMAPQRVHNNVMGSDGETDGVILRLKPAPESALTVRIQGGEGTKGSISAFGKRSGTMSSTQILGEATSLSLKPDRYRISLNLDAVWQVEDPERQLVVFEDQTILFRRQRSGSAVAASAVDPRTIVPPDRKLELEEFATGHLELYQSHQRVSLTRGRYSARILDRNDREIETADVFLDGGEPLRLPERYSDLPHRSLRKIFEGADGLLHFSSSLPPFMDTDLNIWLALVGGGRILSGAPGVAVDWLSSLPLPDFSAFRKGSSCIYVLAGLDGRNALLEATLQHSAGANDWVAATDLPGFPGLKQLTFDAPPQDGVLLSLRANRGSAYTLSSIALNDRVTLVTVTVDELGMPVVSQYLLPIGHLQDSLHPDVRRGLQSRNQIADLKVLAEFQRAFRKRRDIEKIGALQDYLDEALYLKWIDPIAAIIAGYELLRRNRPDRLKHMVRNMLTHFSDVPDSRAIASLAGDRKPGRIAGVPLFLDGLRAIDERRLPFDGTPVDYDGTWIAWHGAIA